MGAALVQAGSVVLTGGSASWIPTLPAASTAGNLLVAIMGCSNGGQVNTAPTGWKRADGITNSGAGLDVWYYEDNPGGISSATFTKTANNAGLCFMLEFSGIVTSSSLDVKNTGSGSGATCAVTMSGSTSGDLAVSAFFQNLTASSAITWTKGSGWTNAQQYTANHYTHVTSDYILSAGTSPSETQTSSDSSTYNSGFLGVIATFLVASGGTPVDLVGDSQLDTAATGTLDLALSGDAQVDTSATGSLDLALSGDSQLDTSATAAVEIALQGAASLATAATGKLGYAVDLAGAASMATGATASPALALAGQASSVTAATGSAEAALSGDASMGTAAFGNLQTGGGTVVNLSGIATMISAAAASVEAVLGGQASLLTAGTAAPELLLGGQASSQTAATAALQRALSGQAAMGTAAKATLQELLAGTAEVDTYATGRQQVSVPLAGISLLQTAAWGTLPAPVLDTGPALIGTEPTEMIAGRGTADLIGSEWTEMVGRMGTSDLIGTEETEMVGQSRP
jgi:hypothetical protein